ncbi:MAG: BlaI/MecI/CopY family transcriptional regulator [bacterium]
MRTIKRTFIGKLLFWSLPICLTTTLTHAQNPNTQIDTTSYAAPAKEILTKNTLEEKQFTVRKHDFIDQVAIRHSALTSDTSLVFEFKLKSYSSLLLSPEELHEITPQGADPGGEAIRRRFHDIPPTVPLNGLIRSLIAKSKSSRKKRSLAEMPLPSDLEIEILKVLWVQPIASSSDIYAQLDSTLPLTSEDLNKILEQMAERGFLDRKKVSPSHEFNLFGIAQIELSSKNRKNKLYLYWPLVPKKELITYLDSKRYLAFAAAQKNGHNGNENSYYKILKEKLNRIIK